jgi:hypothetical protein
MDKKINVIGIVMLLLFAFIIGEMIETSLRGNYNDMTVSSSVNNPTPTLADFFSQEFASSTDIVPDNGIAVGGLGDDLLKSNVWNTLLDYERKQNCRDVTSKAISVEQINEAGEFWVEAWNVDACGKLKVFMVKFTPDQVGGTEYQIIKN